LIAHPAWWGSNWMIFLFFFFIIWITFHFTVSFRHFSNHLTLMSILFIFAELKPMKVIRPWLLADWIGCLSSIWTRSNKF
jgi:hypothetical protein